MSTQAEVLAWGQERARAGPWRDEGGVALLAPLPGTDPLSTHFVTRCVEALAQRGFQSVITAALLPPERSAFLAAGFEEEQRLCLLTHDLRRMPPRAHLQRGQRLRRGRQADKPAALAVDATTFSPFWRLDATGLEDALQATPDTRFRVVVDGDRVVAFAITGRAQSRGYLQRLAVHPDHQRRGLGRALAVDGLRWLRRRRATRAVVNTQPGNDAALRLYTGLGFRPEAVDLAVLRRDLIA